jgi:hypothetical protein
LEYIKAQLLELVEEIDDQLEEKEEEHHRGKIIRAIPSHRFKGISLRWGILWLLSDSPINRLSGQTIIDALVAGGATKPPVDISLVLTTMRVKGEVEGTPEAGYLLTPLGMTKWTAIRNGQKFVDHLESLA